MNRILHCIGSLGFGGSQTFVMEVYRKIDRNKLQFDFVVFPENIEGFYKEVEELGGRVYVCPRYNGKNHFEFVRWWKKFFRDHHEYNIVHGHVRSVALIYLSIATKYGCTTIVHSHSTSNGTGISSFVKKIFQFPLRYTVDYLLSCSDKAGLWLYGKRAVTKKNYIIVPNCIDCQRFAYNESIRNEIRESLGLKKDDFVIGHIGRFYEPKNHPFLLEIFKCVKQKKPNAKLILVGDGDGRNAAELTVKQYGLSEDVYFMGIQKKPEVFYQAMDVFLFPSLWEGLPLTVVEAQAAGLPCVISDTITKDVHLTELVDAVTLQKSSEYWAEKVIGKENNERSEWDAFLYKSFQQFDSYHVVNGLEEFYCSIDDRI